MPTTIPLSDEQRDLLLKIAGGWDTSPNEALTMVLRRFIDVGLSPITCPTGDCAWMVPAWLTARPSDILEVQLAHLLSEHTARDVADLAAQMEMDLDDLAADQVPPAQERANWVGVLADFMFNHQMTRPGGFEAS